MATQGPMIDDGSQTVAGFDARNSTFTGSTLAGPNGSGQFLAVLLSTSSSRTVVVCSTAGSTINQFIYGILQNKPQLGIAADVCIFGVTKAVAGATIASGVLLMPSSTLAGSLVTYSTALGGRPCGQSIESAVVGQIFTAALFGFGQGSTPSL